MNCTVLHFASNVSIKKYMLNDQNILAHGNFQRVIDLHLVSQIARHDGKSAGWIRTICKIDRCDTKLHDTITTTMWLEFENYSLYICARLVKYSWTILSSKIYHMLGLSGTLPYVVFVNLCIKNVLHVGFFRNFVICCICLLEYLCICICVFLY